MSVISDKNHIYYDGKKYVLVSWLKAEIKKKQQYYINLREHTDDDSFRVKLNVQKNALNSILSLLEEKKYAEKEKRKEKQAR
jgi:hypothetical protein